MTKKQTQRHRHTERHRNREKLFDVYLYKKQRFFKSWIYEKNQDLKKNQPHLHLLNQSLLASVPSELVGLGAGLCRFLPRALEPITVRGAQ